MQTHSTSKETWTFEDLYNMLMWDIEPELTTDSLPFLEMMYEGESPEEHAKRMEWYAKAFDTVTERLTLVTDAWNEQVKTLKKDILQVQQDESADDDSTAMSDLEQQISEQL